MTKHSALASFQVEAYIPQVKLRFTVKVIKTVSGSVLSEFPHTPTASLAFHWRRLPGIPGETDCTSIFRESFKIISDARNFFPHFNSFDAKRYTPLDAFPSLLRKFRSSDMITVLAAPSQKRKTVLGNLTAHNLFTKFWHRIETSLPRLRQPKFLSASKRNAVM